MTGKTATSTSSVQVPQEVLDRYTAANNQASAAASQPFQQYSTDPSAFVAPLSATQQTGIQNTNTAANQAQPYYGAATSLLSNGQNSAVPYYQTATSLLDSGSAQGQNLYAASNAYDITGYNAAQPYNTEAQSLAQSGTNAVNAQQIGADQINQFMNPYIGDVLNSTSALLNQNNQQAMAGQLGNAIQSGAFGGDRAGIAAANLNQQQNLANANIYSGILNQGYNTALGAAQQQQGVNLGAAQANRAALQEGANQLQSIGQQQYAQSAGVAQQLANNAQGTSGILAANAAGQEAIGQGFYNMGANSANTLAGLGAGAQSAALQGATAQLSAGQQEQATNQAGLTALYNQFLQQQAYPFQTAQFLANVAEGTGSLSGSTTSTTQPTGLFGNLLSDRRAKEDIKEVGRAKNGLKIYTFKYKGDPEKVTHLGFMADEVEKKHPDAVGLAGGLKTVNYERAARADGGGLMFDPNAGEYGLGAASMPGHGSYVPAPQQNSARRIMFQSTPPSPRNIGLGAAADQYRQLKGLYNDGKTLWNDGSSVVNGLGSAMTYARGGLALKRDDGGPVDDPFQSDEDMLRRQRGLAASETMSENAPNSATATPVSGALTAQQDAPRYSLGAAPSPKGNNTSGGLGELASIAGLGKDVLPYLLALKQGGLVPREHHADGDSVGDDDATNAEIKKQYPSPNYEQPPASPAGLGAADKAPNYGDLKSAKDAFGDAPLPPKRPAGLGIDPAEVEKMPDLKMPDEPMLWHGSDYEKAQSQANNPAPGLGAATAMVPTAEANAPLNVRNNNAGNIIDGTFARSLPGYVGADSRGFAVFDSPEAGERAAERNLIAYSQKGLTTPAQIINRWSPPDAPGNSPEATGNYIKYVSSRLGVSPDTPLDMSDPKVRAATVNAIREFEGGQTKRGSGLAAGIGASASQTAGQSQTPGLVGSLQSFFGGHPDGQTSPNGGMGERALMAVLSGLGAIGSYRGQSGLGALLQGLGAGAHGWMESGKQQADIANQQAQTGFVGAQTGETAARTGEIGARTGTQNAATMQARQELIGKARWVDPYGQMWVHTADDRVMTQDQWDQAGRPALYGQGLGATAVPPPAPTPPAGAGGPGVKSPAPPVAPQPPAAPASPPSQPLVTPPSAEKPPATPFGVNFGDKSVAAAQNDIKSMQGPNFNELSKKSADYPTEVKRDMDAANASTTYTMELAKLLNQAYKDPDSAKAGAGFAGKATAASILNSIARVYDPEKYGTKDFWNNADSLQEKANKIMSLRSAMAAKGAGEHSLGALEMFKEANPNFTQNPDASAELVSQVRADEVKAIDKANHAKAYGAISHGSYFNAPNAFQEENGPLKYNFERDEFKRLLLNTPPPTVEKLMSGKLPANKIREQLVKGGYPESLTRWFTTEQPNGQ